MDEYTRKTRAWLNQHFVNTTADGVYLAHQPIYGIGKGHCHPGLMPRLIKTFNIINTVQELSPVSVLDVGAGEGYTAQLVNELCDARLTVTDLSDEACQRAQEIFGLDAVQADAHELPFPDNSFDVVMTSETLEHVVDWRKCLSEILRVARNAVVITVPHDSREMVKENIKSGEMHAHIHAFDIDSFEYLRQQGCRVKSYPIVSVMSKLLGLISDPLKRKQRPGIKGTVVKIYNYLIPILSAVRKIYRKGLYRVAMRYDDFFVRRFKRYFAIHAVVLKNQESTFSRTQNKRLISKVLNFSVPFHRPEPENEL